MALPSLTLPQLLAKYLVSQDSLVLYEKEGLVSPWREGEDTCYTARDQLRVEIILKGKKLGFTISELKTLIGTHLPPPNPVTIGQDRKMLQIEQLEKEKAELQAAIDRLRANPDGKL